MNFSPNWMHWILECVSTIHYTLLVNGSITQSFKPAKGLGQGNPLSTYLFLMCANIMSLALIKVENNKDIQGVKLGRNGVSFTHLLFADNSLLFFKRDNKSLTNIQQIISWYCSVSGPCVNLAKSDLFCSPNILREDQEALATSLQVNLVQAPSKYLGMNFMLRGRRIVDFQLLVDRLNSKLQGWKAKLLSQASRTTLISFVLQSVPFYVFSCFRVPETICNKMDSFSRSFWWGHELEVRKVHLLNWDEICKPKSKGGLGLKKFSLTNQALVAKQFWRINHNPQSLIARALKAKYFPRCSIHNCTPKPHHSWISRGIINQRNPKLKEGRWGIGKGSDISLTHQAWYPCSTQNLNNPNVQTKTVADLINHSTGTWKPDLVRAMYPYPISEEIMSNPILKTGTVFDKLFWKFSNSGVF